MRDGSAAAAANDDAPSAHAIGDATRMSFCGHSLGVVSSGALDAAVALEAGVPPRSWKSAGIGGRLPPNFALIAASADTQPVSSR